MSTYGVGASSAKSGSGGGGQEHNTPKTSRAGSRNASQERPQLQHLGRTSSDGRHHGVSPLARVSSTSSIRSNSLGRRRRDGNHLEEPQYNMSGGSRSESNLILPVEANIEPEEFSDTESLDGRRVRTKYSSLLPEGRQRSTNSRRTPISEFNGFDFGWTDGASDPPPPAGNSSISNPNGEASRQNAQQPRDFPVESRRVATIGVPIFGVPAFETRESGSSNSNGEGPSQPAENASRPVPPRKNSDWDAARSRAPSNTSRGSISRNDAQMSFDEFLRDIDTSINQNTGARQTGGLSPSPGRVRAASSSSRPYEEAIGQPPPYSPDSNSTPATPPNQTQMISRRLHTDVVLPRWQPDAEVTLCPICRTQFSFFVRKHHCRKCGRVVCNACSPHRITIPYQFIVQPPTDATTPTSRTRPTLDPARAGSDFTSLGGGERVRLCNPCVPDPNIAPPQTPTIEPQRRPSQHSSHSRSSSLATPYYTQRQLPAFPGPRTGINNNFRRREREPSIIGRLAASQSQQQSASLGNNDEYLTAPGAGGSRSRSSTDSSNFNGPTRYSRPGVSQQRSNPQSHAPRDESLQSRPLPRPPRLAEEDECPICHNELPSSALPNSEDLRAAHINSCIESAFGGHSHTATPVPPPSSRPSAQSSSAVVVPVANTPEARAAAREQAHAAVVLGHAQSPTPIRRTGVFPYKATEKDCIDDAECTICLEEYEVGVDMCRLECLCRFHLKCIRQWFELHHGQCPVHQHDGGY